MNYYDTQEYADEYTINEWIKRVNPVELYERIFADVEKYRDPLYIRKVNMFKEFIKEDLMENQDDEFKNNTNEHIIPQIIKDLIDAGQLEQENINGKYKPILEITYFMEWLSKNGYEDYLKYNFFKKFIFYKNTEKTVKQYLKPSMFGIKRQKKKKT
jgi:hypothetical protein